MDATYLVNGVGYGGKKSGSRAAALQTGRSKLRHYKELPNMQLS